MNREEAKKRAEVMLAYAEGKMIQYSLDDILWVDTDEPQFASDTHYRIKPEPAEAWIIYDRDGEMWGAYSSKEDAEIALNYHNDLSNDCESELCTLRHFKEC